VKSRGPLDGRVDGTVHVEHDGDAYIVLSPRATCSVLVVSNDFQPSRVRVGIIGAGQLALMMGEVAHDVGVETIVLATNVDDAAAHSCDEVVLGEAKDLGAVSKLASVSQVITLDHELVDLEQLARLEREGIVVRPSSDALRFAVDKAYQRQRFLEAALPVPRFIIIRTTADPLLESFLEQLPNEPVLKAARGGYDGRGVLFPADRVEAVAMIDELSATGDVLIEERLELLGEVAQLVVRGIDGAIELYPLVTTVQSDGMCVEVRVPAEVSTQLVDDASALGRKIATLIDVVGILAIELFVTSAGLVINEVATSSAQLGPLDDRRRAVTSQFANHLAGRERPITGRHVCRQQGSP
jgi:5-(carboxyamino)imidazole ribonucleotide synthase